MIVPRPAIPTVRSVDTYCQFYKDLFPEVRTYEYFKFIHVGLIGDLKRKSLPAIAEMVGLDNSQGLHHFLTRSPWQAEELEKRRLELILKVLEGRAIDLIVDETGDKKKGEKTDYVKRQYIGNLGKIENGMVSVNGYGHCEGMTVPLKFKIFKPQDRLKPGDEYKSKPVLGAEIVRELQDSGFQIQRVLADSLQGENASNFLSVLEELNIDYAVSILRNGGEWLPDVQKERVNEWREVTPDRRDGKTDTIWVREIIFDPKRSQRYWEITADKNGDSDESRCLVITQIPHLKYWDIGSICEIRACVENGFKRRKSELGWADFQFTRWPQIEKWWQLVMSAYLMISLQNDIKSG